jgi:hypothetical protein
MADDLIVLSVGGCGGTLEADGSEKKEETYNGIYSAYLLRVSSS